MDAVEHDQEDDFRNPALDCCTRRPEIAEFLRAVGAKHFNELDATT